MQQDAAVELAQVFKFINRAFNEEEAGHFHMTVKELQTLYSQHDVDLNGRLNTQEISKILETVHMVTKPAEIASFMRRHDRDSDEKMDFEEFVALCQVAGGGFFSS